MYKFIIKLLVFAYCTARKGNIRLKSSPALADFQASGFQGLLICQIVIFIAVLPLRILNLHPHNLFILLSMGSLALLFLALVMFVSPQLKNDIIKQFEDLSESRQRAYSVGFNMGILVLIVFNFFYLCPAVFG